MSRRFSLPVLPLRETVVYPGVAVPISAGRPGTVEAVQEAMDGDRLLFAVAQHENQDEPDPQILYAVGTVVRIIQTHRARGGIQLLVQGESRARAVQYSRYGDAMLRATLVGLERFCPVDKRDPEFKALDSELRERAAELGTRRGQSAEALNQVIQGVDEPGAFADLVVFYLELPTAEKQRLLEMLDDEERMKAALVAVERELVRIDAQEDIQAKVQEELGERQREMLLREQMKQIRKELGEEGDREDADELRERIEALPLTETARKEVDRELRRLDRTAPQSAEYQVIRTYLEWITELPWGERTDDKIDLRRADEILEEDHYGLEDVKDRVLEFLAVRKLQQERFEEDEEEGTPMRRERQPAATMPRRARPDEAPAAAVPSVADTGEAEAEEDPLAHLDETPPAARVPSFSSPARPGSARRASRGRSRGRWDANTSGFRSAARATRPTSGVIAGPTWGRCRPDHPGHEGGGEQEPGLPSGRGGQARRVLPGRPERGAPRSPRSGAELHLHRPLPGRALRPLRGAVHRDREL